MQNIFYFICMVTNISLLVLLYIIFFNIFFFLKGWLSTFFDVNSWIQITIMQQYRTSKLYNRYVYFYITWITCTYNSWYYFIKLLRFISDRTKANLKIFPVTSEGGVAIVLSVCHINTPLVYNFIHLLVLTKLYHKLYILFYVVKLW